MIPVENYEHGITYWSQEEVCEYLMQRMSVVEEIGADGENKKYLAYEWEHKCDDTTANCVAIMNDTGMWTLVYSLCGEASVTWTNRSGDVRLGFGVQPMLGATFKDLSWCVKEVNDAVSRAIRQSKSFLAD